VTCIASESFEGDSSATLIAINVCQVIDRIPRKPARVPAWRDVLADRLAVVDRYCYKDSSESKGVNY